MLFFLIRLILSKKSRFEKVFFSKLPIQGVTGINAHLDKILIKHFPKFKPQFFTFRADIFTSS